VTTKADYTPEEWELLKEVFFTTASLVIMVSPNNLLGIFKEARTIWKAIEEIAKIDNCQLVQAIINDKTPEDEKKLDAETEEVTGGAVVKDVLNNCRQVAVILAAKATPEEAHDYKKQVLAICTKTASAAVEPGGGFLGFGGKRINEKEDSAIKLVATALDYREIID
jgi:hypothetical protein